MVSFSMRGLFSASPMTLFPNDVVALLKALMDIMSSTGHEGDAIDYLVEGLHSDGWHVVRQRVGSAANGRANVYATRNPKKVARLVFNSHIDTVPPHFGYKDDGVNVYGRGSCDAKGQVACMIMAARRIVKEYPEMAEDIGLLFVEANKLENFGPEYLIVGEPTEMKYATIQKGALKVKLSVTGRAGHSGYPHAGESAVHKLVEILGDIIKYEWPKDEKIGDTTLNIGAISGGQALNAWAAKAEASIFFRVTTSYADVKERLEKIVAGRADLDHSLGGNDPVFLSLPSFPHTTGQAAFNTDIPYYHKYRELKGVYLFGAGSITVAHGPGEFVPISELKECIEKHIELAKDLLKAN